MPKSLFKVFLKPQACNFIKKETLAQVFFCEFCEIFKNTFFTEHLRTIVSVSNQKERQCYDQQKITGGNLKYISSKNFTRSLEKRLWQNPVSAEQIIPANINLFKVNNRNTRKRCEICSKLTIKTRPRSGVFIVNFEHNFTPFSSVSTVDFEQVNVNWGRSITISTKDELFTEAYLGP